MDTDLYRRTIVPTATFNYGNSFNLMETKSPVCSLCISFRVVHRDD